MQTVLMVQGSKLKIEFLAEGVGSSKLEMVLNGLPLTDRTALHAVMQRLANGERISDDRKFKKIEGTELWEIKRFQDRFVGFYAKGGRFLVVAYEQKKKDRLSRPTLDRAEAYRKKLINPRVMR
jgi:Gp49-like protein DUF891